MYPDGKKPKEVARVPDEDADIQVESDPIDVKTLKTAAVGIKNAHWIRENLFFLYGGDSSILDPGYICTHAKLESHLHRSAIVRVEYIANCPGGGNAWNLVVRV